MSKSKTKNNNSSVSRDTELSEAFELFWKAYPKREGSNPKHPARLKFFRRVKVQKVDPAVITRAAEAYSAECKKLKTAPRYIAMAVTWLNQQRWEDAPAGDNVMSVEEFRQKMKEYEEKKQREREERRRRL